MNKRYGRLTPSGRSPLIHGDKRDSSNRAAFNRVDINPGFDLARELKSF